MVLKLLNKSLRKQALWEQSLFLTDAKINAQSNATDARFTFQQSRSPFEDFREFQHHGQRQMSSFSQICRNKFRSCRTTSLLMNTWLRMKRTHILRKHTFKRKKTWEACRLYLPWKRFFDVSSVALYPVAQVFWSWARVAATQSLMRLEVFRSARWPKLSQCLTLLKGCARSKPDLRRVDPKFQCSPLSQAKKNIVTLTKLQRVYYQLSLAALSRETGLCSGGSNWLNRSSSRQSVKTNAYLFSLSSKIKVGTSTPGFGVFLLVVFALQVGPVSV